MYRVIGTKHYFFEINKWPKNDYLSARKLPKKLAENPYVGKQLSFPFLREKKIGGRRVYYLIYDDLLLVLLVAASGKKDQNDTIKHIKSKLVEFRRIAEDILTQ
tara:strand:+ start:448 stop:759 length:312 start_codon:yes stop_codon:yes gene_type:complete